ncbi:MAG: tRNA-specific adenosine deaminase [Firmicutes bacterium ADurb.Bin193]|nr:MAG: tRNA-specific adenosine deaminase [Firmicutes bacterium ADurb.Bin193]
MSATDNMALALSQAEMAMDKGEIPVGAVIVKDGAVIAKAHNLREKSGSVFAHAEAIAIEMACKAVGGWRLDGCDIYVTLEPCPMCAGAIIQARIANVYFGSYDRKNGAFGTVADLSSFKWTHKPVVYGGIMEDECGALLKTFFSNLRAEG